MVDSLRDLFQAWTRRIMRRPENASRERYLDALDRCIRIPEPHRGDAARGLWGDCPEIVVMHDHAVGRLYDERREELRR